MTPKLFLVFATLMLSTTVAHSRTITWKSNATKLRTQVGKTFSFVCPAGRSMTKVYGSNVYTTDSSICNAGVHAGKITAAGGNVKIRIVAGMQSYVGTERNGVRSLGWQYYGWSFVFEGASLHKNQPRSISWRYTAASIRTNVGQTFKFSCLPVTAGRRTVYGTDVYTADSSICGAAMHAGYIVSTGGPVTIKITSGQPSYLGTMRNFVSSRSWRSYGWSFVFIGPKMSGKRGPVKIGWGTTATNYRIMLGRVFKFRCPKAAQFKGHIYGTLVYTTDSPICLAAAHAGKILKSGGVVSIRILPGLSDYRGAFRNGVVSRSWKTYRWSYSFVDGRSGRLGPLPIGWLSTATIFRDQLGKTIRFSCPAKGKLQGRVYGTNFYTADSAICVAAVHAGAITVAAGGAVKIRLVGGKSRYAGTKKNGVSTRGWHSYRWSFIVVK